MPPLTKPRPLPPGGTIGIAAPAFPIDPETLAAGEAMWRALGFRTQRRDDLLAVDGFLAGDDARRAKELMDLFLDPDVDAVVEQHRAVGLPLEALGVGEGAVEVEENAANH